MILLNDQSKELLFETSQTALHQCDETDRYVLHFQGSEVTFRPCELISFKRRIQLIDLAQMLSSDTPDIEIVHMPHCDRLFVLTIGEVLELRELFAGAFAMIELNSLIHKEIVRKGN